MSWHYFFLFFIVLFSTSLDLIAYPFGFVSNSDSNTLSAIDLSKNEVVYTVPIITPTFPAITPDKKYLYVSNFTTAKVTVLDTKNLATVKVINLEAPIPSSAVVTPDGQYVLVSSQYAGILFIIDAKTNEIVKKIEHLNAASLPVVSEDSSTAYVSDGQSDKLYVIDLKTLTLTKTLVTNYPWLNPAVVSKNNKVLFVANNFSLRQITRFESNNTTTQTISGVATMLLSKDETKLYALVNNFEKPGVVLVLNSTDLTPIKSIEVGLVPENGCLSENGRYLYVPNTGSDSLSIIDTENNQVIKTLAMGPSPTQAIAYPKGQYIYVTNSPYFKKGFMSVIDTKTNEVIDMIALGKYPLGPCFGDLKNYSLIKSFLKFSGNYYQQNF